MNRTKKMFERINWYKKEFVHDQYSRIVEKFKDYEKISKKKMIEDIYKEYADYKNILDICTTRELKYLKKVLDDKTDKKALLKDEFEWERDTLRGKFLLQQDLEDIFIPDEIFDEVKEAIAHVKWSTTRKLDSMNEILVSFCKIQASALLDTVVEFALAITNIDRKFIYSHVFNNRVFKYYVMVYNKDIEGLGNDIYVCLYQDYYSIEDQIEEERKKQGIPATMPLDLKIFQTLFYNTFDINNKKIAKFLKELKKLPFFWFSAIKPIQEFAVLNIDRTPLKESIREIPALKKCDLTQFFEMMDEAMDEMPSGALNGLTPNQAKEFYLENEKIKQEKRANYIEQQNACLSPKDTDLFYKIYFALLEYTNKKYEIKKGLKIYKSHHVDPYELHDVIERFWESKDLLVSEFCASNPYKFDEEELKITSDFKKGFREIVIIAKFEHEFTAIMSKDKTYMIKGLTTNLDKVVSYEKLPLPVVTAIIPFKNVLVYDGILAEMSIKMDNNFARIIEEQYSHSMKYYHF